MQIFCWILYLKISGLQVQTKLSLAKLERLVSILDFFVSI